MELSVRAQALIDRSPNEVFDVAADYRAWPKVITKTAVIPGVAAVEMLDGAQPGPGAHRRIALTDGSTVEEEILVFERGVEHRYQWVNPPAPPLSYVLKTGHASWLFDRSGHGTKVSWTYRLGVSSTLAYPAALVVAFFFRRWMEQSLLNLETAIAQ